MRNLSDNHRYDDILNVPRPVSNRHPKMSLYNRAAQFSPFAALTGYEESINETARLTSDRIEIDEYTKEEINRKIQILEDNLSSHPKVTITYFVYDKVKYGGEYVTITSNIKKIDTYSKGLYLSSGEIIPIGEIIAMESNIFDPYIV